MKITQKLETDKKNNSSHIQITLSNGDDVWIYDDNGGYGTVTIYRHDTEDEFHGKSTLTSSTERPMLLRKCQAVVKEKKIAVSRKFGYQTTVVNVEHYYPKK